MSTVDGVLYVINPKANEGNSLNPGIKRGKSRLSP